MDRINWLDRLLKCMRVSVEWDVRDVDSYGSGEFLQSGYRNPTVSEEFLFECVSTVSTVPEYPIRTATHRKRTLIFSVRIVVSWRVDTAFKTISMTFSATKKNQIHLY